MLRYHIPCTWIHRGENLLVLHEELGGDPSLVSLLTRAGQDICSFVSEADPPPVDSWKPNVEFKSQIPQVRLACDRGWHISSINLHATELLKEVVAHIVREDVMLTRYQSFRRLALAMRNVQSLYPRLILATHALECRKALQLKLIISNFQCIAAISIPEL
ncbi:hypothetical protein LWI28_005597 [Acer negundo]|uniref:Uncharacterized protein n=1 Tax=Acer negundo TaxID=4023 RepID=A0AAD5JSA2_ACENE|nr:hypothetical protein LWI28_005597 [Acer negundo]